MDTTIRNLDAKAYRALRARAAAEGRTVGTLVSEAIRAYLRPPRPTRRVSMFDLPAFDLGPGSERLSEQVDEILYGEPR